MATTLWPQSGVLQHELTVNEIAFGATVEFFDGGTTNPKIVYQDSAESVSFGSMVEVDQYGRWPNIFVPTGLPYAYLIRSGGIAGSTIHYADNVPNPNPAPGSSEPAPAETIAPGTPRWFFKTGELAGWVRINGRTIGSATSGATERANDDTEDLFKDLWNSNPQSTVVVVGGRGGSADADWAANKQLTLPDMRGAGAIGADDMGNTAAGLFASVPFDTGSETVSASVGGYNSTNITTAQLPVHSHNVSLTSGSNGSHTHPVSLSTQSAGSHNHSGSSTSGISANHTHSLPKAVATSADIANIQSGGSTAIGNVSFENLITNINSADHFHSLSISTDGGHTHSISGNTNTAGSHTHSVSGATQNVGSGAGFSIVHRFAIVTWYIKL